MPAKPIVKRRQEIWPPLTEEERLYWADRCRRCGEIIPVIFEDCSCWYDEDWQAPARFAFDNWLRSRSQ
jgi:hypothetical protein